MDFNFNLDDILQTEITQINKDSALLKRQGNRCGFREQQNELFEVINRMGEASARAQELHASITTRKKFEFSNHCLYILRDIHNKNIVIGFLKVGKKKLFVYDYLQKQHELEPLCVLDFYVHESKQRTGCGRKLFDFMLQKEQVNVTALAIDRPSPKLMSFLKKHYDLKVNIPQVNNFVIFDGFFKHQLDRGRRNSYRDQFQDFFQPGLIAESSLPPSNLNKYKEINPNSYNNVENPGHRMVAGEMMYSRHSTTPPNNSHQSHAVPNRSSKNEFENHSADQISPRSQHNQRKTPVSNKDISLENSSPKPYSESRFPMISSAPPGSRNHSASSRPPSGKNHDSQTKAITNPMYHQGSRPPDNYKDMFNMHRTYQGRSGHLVSTSPAERNINYALPETKKISSLHSPSRPAFNRNSSWTVMGVLRNQQLNSRFGPRYYQSRLW